MEVLLKVIKKQLIILLSVLLVFSFIPSAAFTTELPEEAVNTIPPQERVLANIEETPASVTSFDEEAAGEETGLQEGVEGEIEFEEPDLVMPDIEGSVLDEAKAGLFILGAEGASAEEIQSRAEEGDVTLADAFPDPSFREYVKIIIYGDINCPDETVIDDVALTAIENRPRLTLSNRGIYSLEGIEYFKNLTELSCHGNKLSSLDISANKKLTILNCSTNPLGSIDVSNNLELQTLKCTNIGLTSLDLSQAPQLLDLTCDSNMLGTIDVSVCPGLQSLNCGSTGLTSLDLSSNPALQTLKCGWNQLTTLDLSNNPLLTNLSCQANRIISIEGLSGLNLTECSASGQSIVVPITESISTGFSYESILTYPIADDLSFRFFQSFAEYDEITQRFLSNSASFANYVSQYGSNKIEGRAKFEIGIYTVEFKDWDGTLLKSESVNYGSDATPPADPTREDHRFIGWDKPYTNIVGNTVIQARYADKYDPTRLTMREAFPDDGFFSYVKREVLQDESIGDDTILDDAMVALIRAHTDIVFAKLTVYGLEGLQYFSALESLDVSQNNIYEIDVSANTMLSKLDCGSALISELDVSKNPLLEELICNNNSLSEIDVSNNPALKTLVCFYNNLSSLDVRSNPELRVLHFSNNQVSEIDVSNNLLLEELVFYDNQVSVLDVGVNTALEELWCSDNQIEVLDVSTNTALTHFECSNNQIEVLDVSTNTKLDDFWCDGNLLTEINVDNNTLLKEFNCSGNPITELNLDNNTVLKTVWCGATKLNSLDVSDHPTLRDLLCESSELTYLDITNAPHILQIDCSENRLLSVTGIGTSLSSVSLQAYDQRVTIPVIHAESGPYAYESVEAYFLNPGFDLTLDQADTYYDETTNRFLVDDFGEDDFELSDGMYNISGTIAFEIATYAVDFWNWDGALLKTDIVPHKGDATPPEVPEREGYRFVDWDTPYTNIVANTMVLAQYATWTDPTGLTLLEAFPDDAFRAWVKEEVLGDATLPDDTKIVGVYADDIKNRIDVEVPNLGIHSLQGIEFFVSAEELDCSSNYLTNLDLRGNTVLDDLDADDNMLLTIIGLSQLTPSDFSAEDQAIEVPTIPRVSRSFAYESDTTYPLETGFDMVISQATALYDSATELFLTNKLNTVDFSSTNSTYTINGTITFGADEHVVFFVDWDDTVLKADTVAHGQDATPPEAPQREGFTFVGWDTPHTNVTESTAINALYEQIPVNPVDPANPTTPGDGSADSNKKIGSGTDTTAAGKGPVPSTGDSLLVLFALLAFIALLGSATVVYAAIKRKS